MNAIPPPSALPRWLHTAHLGWILWATFALVIAVHVYFKPTRISLRDGTEWALVSESGDALRLRRKVGDVLAGGRRVEERTVPASQVLWRFPYGERSVTPEYRKAALSWWRGEEIYAEGLHGFLYLPQAAIAFTPFAVLPGGLGEMLWRLMGIAAYAAGVWSLCGVLAGRGGPRPAAFTVATALAIPAAVGSASNGQSNLVLGGLIALAGGALARGGWVRAGVLLAVAVALKPLAVVPLLLAAAVYPRTLLPITASLAVLALLPLAHPDPSYAVEQYGAAWAKLGMATRPRAGDYQDLAGLLWTAGVELAPPVWLGLRLGAAGLVLAACALARRRLGEGPGALYLIAFGCSYVVLLNPRTEGLTYALLGPPVAMWATAAVLSGRRGAAVALVLLCLVLQFSRAVTGGRNVWLRPAATLALAAGLIAGVVTRRDGLGAARP